MKYIYRKILCVLLVVSMLLCSEGFTSLTEAATSISQSGRASTKKGIQIAPAEMNKAIELGCTTVFVNFNFSDFTTVTSDDNQGENTFSYNGVTYAVNLDVIRSFNDHFLYGKSNGIETIYCALTARSLPGLTDTSTSSALLHAFNTWDSTCKENIDKMFNLLAKYMGAYVDYWVIGNEVDHPSEWYETGGMSSDTFVKYYEITLRIMNDAAKKYNPKSRVMISLDYLWNYTWHKGVNSKYIIDELAALTASDDYDWGVAIHPYPLNLTDPNFADDHLQDNGYWVTNDVTTRAITMDNLDVFTNYMQSENLLYNGMVRPIAITEIGFTAYTKTTSGLVNKIAEQAAYYAYAYYKAEANPYIDAFHMRCYQDAEAEIVGGLYFGIYDLQGNARNLYEVMKYINTVNGNSVTDRYLSVIGASSWANLIAGYYNIPFVSGASYSGLYYQASDGKFYYLTRGDVDSNYNGFVADHGYVTYLENGVGLGAEDYYYVKMRLGSGGAQINTKVLDNTNVEFYYVDDESVATVAADGKITPKGVGTTVLDIVSDNGSNSGMMSVIIKVTNPFTDVAESSWYSDSVDYVYANGLITGINDYTFDPKRNLTRGMTAVILWRLAGCPEPKGTGYFPDVSVNSYCVKAVNWAYENGIITGRGNGTFASGESITRQDFALMLYRYAKYAGFNTYVWDTESYKACSDYNKTYGYATTAVQWAYNNQIMGVNSDLKPRQSITRAETATMLERFLKQLAY